MEENQKSVYDTRVYKTKDLTKQVINEVKNVITPNDVQRAYSNPNSNVPLDIKINNQKIRVNIKSDASTGGNRNRWVLFSWKLNRKKKGKRHENRKNKN